MTKVLSNLSKKAIGQIAELRAERFLKSKGFKLVAKNFASTYGEIDLVMLDGEVLVFVEVRLRKSQLMGLAAETVDYTKQNKIIQTAEFFLSQEKKFQNHFIRFDIISFDGINAKAHWIESAFEA